MRATLSDETASVKQEPTSESFSVTTIRRGDEFELGKVQRKKKEVWVTVTLDNGTTGYIAGSTHIFAVQKVEAIGNDLEVFEAPDETSPVLKTIPKKTAFTIRGFEKTGETEWFEMRDADIKKGYIRHGAKLRVVPEVTKASARKMIITGAIFAVAGIAAFFILQPKAGASGDTSFLAVGLILLGLFQVVQGYLQYRKTTSEEKPNQ